MINPPIAEAKLTNRGGAPSSTLARRKRRLASYLRRGSELGGRRLLLVLQAGLLLVAARVALRFVPVARLLEWKSRPLSPGRRPSAAEATLIRADVRYAILVVSRYSPLRFVCFPQCLAGAALLRFHGLESKLHYGVTREHGCLLTHTWLESSGEVIIGGEVAPQYARLGTF